MCAGVAESTLPGNSGSDEKMDDADPELGAGIGHVRRPISRLRIPANKMKGRDNPPARN